MSQPALSLLPHRAPQALLSVAVQAGLSLGQGQQAGQVFAVAAPPGIATG